MAARAMSALRVLGSVTLFTIVFYGVGGIVGWQVGDLVMPWTTEQAVRLSDLRLLPDDLPPSLIGGLAWTIAVHPAAALAGCCAALAAPRLGWWRLALVVLLAGEAFRYTWTSASWASWTLQQVPSDAINRVLHWRMASAGGHLLALSTLAALPTAFVSAWLGCLLRPRGWLLERTPRSQRDNAGARSTE